MYRKASVFRHDRITFQFSFMGELIRFAENYMVLRFRELSEKTSSELQSLFLHVLGLSLEEQKEHGPVSDWIHGINYTDVFMQRVADSHSALSSLTYVSEHNYYCWHQEGGVKTGEVKRELYAQGFGFSKRELNSVRYDESPLFTRIERLQRIIEASQLRKELKDEILAVMSHD